MCIDQLELKIIFSVTSDEEQNVERLFALVFCYLI